MKAIKLQGPWAHYERQISEKDARIAQLEAEVCAWQPRSSALVGLDERFT